MGSCLDVGPREQKFGKHTAKVGKMLDDVLSSIVPGIDAVRG
jgi:hypothetical protein